MYKYFTKRMFTILALALVFTGCEKDEKKMKVDEDGLTKDIRDLIPDDILVGIKDLGMPIYGGNTPPDITGTFLASPLILVKSNFDDSYAPGQLFLDVKLTFSDQNNKNLTLKVLDENGDATRTGTGGFIVGSGKKFTVFTGLDNVQSGHTYKTAALYSGTISDAGIADFRYVLVMVDDNNPPASLNILKDGQGRLFKDDDGLAERVSNTKSSVQNIETLYPGACDSK